jgi:uncharacterized membrane protein YcaP (DUF421 family)
MNPYLTIILSSTAVYFFIIIAFRIMGKKELAQLSIFDLVFVLLISNAVQNAMLVGDNTLQGGLIAAATLFVLNYALKLLLYYFPKFNSVMTGKEVMLIYKGKIKHENLQRTHITPAELEEAVREHGVKEIRKVDLAVLEVDGNISVLSNEYQKQSNHSVKRKKRPLRLRRS